MADILVHKRLLDGGRHASRRAFFHTIGVSVAGGVLAALGIERLASLSMPAAPALVRSTFAGHVGDVFLARSESVDPVMLQLFKVRDLRASWSRGGQLSLTGGERRFSILFRGPLDRPLPQESYRFEHARLGRFALFIVPMRPEPDARYYEAIFN